MAKATENVGDLLASDAAATAVIEVVAAMVVAVTAIEIVDRGAIASAKARARRRAGVFVSVKALAEMLSEADVRGEKALATVPAVQPLAGAHRCGNPPKPKKRSNPPWSASSLRAPQDASVES